MEDGGDIASVRRAGTEDRAQVVRFMLEFNAGEAIACTEAGLSGCFEALLTHPDWGTVLIAEVGGVPVGHAVVTFCFDFEFGGREAFLMELFVRPRDRGRRIGATLLAAAERYASEAGTSHLQLVVRRDNTGAQRFYRDHDFRFDPRLLMTKRLGG